MMLFFLVFSAAPVPCTAEAACTEVAAAARVEVGREELTLADLLTHGSCGQFRQAAARMSLGTAPRAGRSRVFDGRQIRAMIEEIAGETGQQPTIAIKTPERIVVQSAGAMKSCGDIGGYLAGASALQPPAIPSHWQNRLDCSGAHAIPGNASIELTKTTWNAALQRWEFSLRCTRTEDCGPFLVSLRRETSAFSQPGGSPSPRDASVVSVSSAGTRSYPAAESSGGGRLVTRGQTATLSWEQAGIRVVLPVTCLDAGGLGQFVRVQLKNAPRIIRAEVLSDGTLRASL